MSQTDKLVNVLLVDDDELDRRLVKLVLIKAAALIQFSVETAGNMNEAVAKLNSSSFDIVLLDLNLPVLTGHQVLKRMKEDPRTRRIPVIILTTSEDSREVHKCYELGCNVFITKPVDYGQFTEAVRKIGLFISIVQLPNGE